MAGGSKKTSDGRRKTYADPSPTSYETTQCARYSLALFDMTRVNV